jgi:acetyltransferase-like isoleucine patch superfamily enzyme
MSKKYFNLPIDFSDGSHFRTIGLGTILFNFVVQKIFRVNKSTPFMLHYTSRINVPQKIFIKNSINNKSVYRCFASSNCCYMNATNGIEIGENVLFASGVKIISANHDINNRENHVKSEPIIIEDNVWLGANVVVLPGVKIGKNTIVGASSVVTKSLDSDSVYVGNPVRKIRDL